MTVSLHMGDCLDLLRSVPTASVDAVIADPPYSINTKSDGFGKLSPWADRVNAAFWYAEWINACRRILRPSGALWTCLNWRSLVTFQKASDDLRWPIESLLVWDKRWIGTGTLRGLRGSYELVALFAGPDFAIRDRSLADVQAFPWYAVKPNGHPAEKPESLMAWLIGHSTPPGGVVLDPFMGSGTTGVAAVQLGRSFIGMEIDPTYYAIAERRIAGAQAQPSLLPVEDETHEQPALLESEP